MYLETVSALMYGALMTDILYDLIKLDENFCLLSGSFIGVGLFFALVKNWYLFTGFFGGVGLVIAFKRFIHKQRI